MTATASHRVGRACVCVKLVSRCHLLVHSLDSLRSLRRLALDIRSYTWRLHYATTECVQDRRSHASPSPQFFRNVSWAGVLINGCLDCLTRRLVHRNIAWTFVELGGRDKIAAMTACATEKELELGSSCPRRPEAMGTL